MFQTRKPNGALWLLAGLAVGCLAVVAAFFAAGERELGFFFSSDSLYLPSIYRDIFQEGGHLRQWSLNAAPNFFPDMGIFFMTEGLTESFLSATYIFPMVQFIGFFFFFHVALRLGTGLRDGRPATFAAMMVAMVFLWSIHGWDFYLAFLLLMNSWHLGALLNALMALCLLLWPSVARAGCLSACWSCLQCLAAPQTVPFGPCSPLRHARSSCSLHSARCIAKGSCCSLL